MVYSMTNELNSIHYRAGFDVWGKWEIFTMEWDTANCLILSLAALI